MKLLSVIAIWFCCVVIVVLPAASAQRRPPPTPQSPRPPPARPPPPPPNEPTIFDLSLDAATDSYSYSIKSLRDKFKGNKEYSGVSMMKPPSEEREFTTVVLKGPQGDDIQIGIHVRDLYVVAYQEGNRAHFLTNFRTDAKAKLFPDIPAIDKKNIPFSGSYSDLEAKAGARKKNELGLGRLRNIFQTVIGKEIDANYRRAQAKFLITVIQMISEAARFKYIEDKIVSAGAYEGFYPDAKTISLQNNWQKISKAFVDADKGKPISVQLEDEDGNEVTVTRVEDLVPDVGLLKYETGSGTTSVEDDDGLLLQFPENPALIFPTA